MDMIDNTIKIKRSTAHETTPNILIISKRKINKKFDYKLEAGIKTPQYDSNNEPEPTEKPVLQYSDLTRAQKDICITTNKNTKLFYPNFSTKFEWVGLILRIIMFIIEITCLLLEYFQTSHEESHPLVIETYTSLVLTYIYLILSSIVQFKKDKTLHKNRFVRFTLIIYELALSFTLSTALCFWTMETSYGTLDIYVINNYIIRTIFLVFFMFYEFIEIYFLDLFMVGVLIILDGSIILIITSFTSKLECSMCNIDSRVMIIYHSLISFAAFVGFYILNKITYHYYLKIKISRLIRKNYDNLAATIKNQQFQKKDNINVQNKTQSQN